MARQCSSPYVWAGILFISSLVHECGKCSRCVGGLSFKAKVEDPGRSIEKAPLEWIRRSGVDSEEWIRGGNPRGGFEDGFDVHTKRTTKRNRSPRTRAAVYLE